MVDRKAGFLGLASVALCAGVGFGLLTFEAGAEETITTPVALDSDLAIRLRGRVPAKRLNAENIRIRTDAGAQARGAFVQGRVAFDKVNQRRVVVRPEAIREYFQLVKQLDREAADRKTAKLLRSVERTGRTKKIDRLVRELRSFFGASSGAGVRLDDPDVFAPVPPSGLLPGDPLRPYRQLVAGDDSLWSAHQNGDLTAFPELRVNEGSERFYHPVDKTTGASDPESVFRQREHRRVIVHRNRRWATFLPQIPQRPDISDAGLQPGTEYSMRVVGPLRTARFVTDASTGARASLATRAVFVTRATEPLFVSPDSRVGDASARPRIVTVTPPNGEADVDPTTDWEDPDNKYVVPVPARRLFVVRLRFAQPLDPRTVNETTFRINKVAIDPDGPNEAIVQEVVPVGVFLSQTRLGEVRVDVTPTQNLDANSRYQVVVVGVVRSLAGESLQLDYQMTFDTY